MVRSISDLRNAYLAMPEQGRRWETVKEDFTNATALQLLDSTCYTSNQVRLSKGIYAVNLLLGLKFDSAFTSGTDYIKIEVLETPSSGAAVTKKVYYEEYPELQAYNADADTQANLSVDFVYAITGPYSDVKFQLTVSEDGEIMASDDQYNTGSVASALQINQIF